METWKARPADGELLDRSQLEQLALDAGLQTVKSVTTKCGALIAADPASMSGKAKKARDSGVPIFSVEQFLAWVNELEV